MSANCRRLSSALPLSSRSECSLQMHIGRRLEDLGLSNA